MRRPLLGAMFLLVASTTYLCAQCIDPPSYDDTGISCPDATVSCRCSEFFNWNAATGPVVYYEVQRKAASGSSWYTVGNLNAERTIEDENGDPLTVAVGTRWFVAKDSSFPQEGTLYDYRVRACGDVCTEWTGAVQYRGAPYWCGAPTEQQCYVGDTTTTP